MEPLKWPIIQMLDDTRADRQTHVCFYTGETGYVTRGEIGIYNSIDLFWLHLLRISHLSAAANSVEYIHLHIQTNEYRYTDRSQIVHICRSNWNDWIDWRRQMICKLDSAYSSWRLTATEAMESGDRLDVLSLSPRSLSLSLFSNRDVAAGSSS